MMNNAERNKTEKRETLSRLAGKQHSPLIIRKYTFWGFPIYVALICDHSLDDLDDIVADFIDRGPVDHKKLWESQSIQDKRNFAGMLSDEIVQQYHPLEGVAVILYVDKMVVSSLRGDFMNHTSCRIELYSLLNMMPHV
jgi:hypothetical protein